jgi:hypothetical protein
MKRIIVLAAFFVGLTLMRCQDTKEDQKEPVTEKDIYKTVGEEIPFDTGMEWIRYYREENSGQSRTASYSYNVSSSQVGAVLDRLPGIVGVAFHYALDDAGAKHVIVIPVDGSLSLWSSIQGRVYIDANSGSEISQTVAAAWADRFKAAHPTAIWFHFFGKNIFDDMRALPYFDSVFIEPAINVLNLTPQLLLVVYNDTVSLLGRKKSSPGTVYDASNACPPCAAR